MSRPSQTLLPLSRRGLFVAAGAAALSACAPPAPTITRLRVGYQKNGVLLLAKSRGLVRIGPKAVRVQWVEFPSGPPLLEALNAGAVDFGATGDTPPIFAQAAGAALSYVAVQPLTGEGEAIIVPAASPLHKAGDLKGKRIAFTKASSSHLMVVEALKTASLTLADVQPIFLSPSDAASAFAKGAVDAWATWDPYLALAQQQSDARVLISGAALPKSDAFYLASNHLVQTAPAVLSQFLDALRAEAAWGEAHRAELIKIISDANGLPAAIVETNLRRGRLGVEPVTPEVVARQQASADTFAALKVIPSKIQVAKAAWTGWTPAP